eukprot:gene30820-38096_t
MARLHVDDLTTATYLSEFEKVSFPNLRYLSYPRGDASSSHFYFAHEVHAQPDFDHVVHGTVDQCSGEGGSKLVHAPGASWEVLGLPNTIENKLTPEKTYQITLISPRSTEQSQVTCTLTVLEFLHCMIGPGFAENCY